MEEQVKLMERRIENQDKKLDEIMMMMREMKEATCNNSNNSGESPRVINKTGGNPVIKTLGYTPKIEFPKFDGSGSRNWVKKCVKYFALCSIPEEQRVDLASLHMVDKAEIWMTNYLSIRKNVEWSEFVMDLNARFNDETGCNVVQQFNKLQQTSTIETSYIADEFDNLRSLMMQQNHVLPDSYFLDSFVGGLKPGIKPFVRPTTVASSSAPSNPCSSGTTFSTAPASPFTITPNSSSAAISNVVSSGWRTNKAPVVGSVGSSPSPSTLFSFGASSTASATSSMPILFGQSTGTSSVSTFSFTSPTATSSALPSLSQPQPVFESRYAVRATGNSGDQMNMEDSMAEDPVHSSNPSVPVFGQPLSTSSNPTVPAFGQSLVSPSPPGFMFGSTAPQSVSPFQFGGQQNQAAPPIPSFQASNSGGSFSLGSGGGDKGSRKMVRISKNRNRKK